MPLEDAAARCCLRVLLPQWCALGAGMLVPPLQGAAVKVVRMLWNGHGGVGAGCCCRVPLSALEGMLVLLQSR